MKICIVGAGKRIHEMYGPVINKMSNVEIGAFWNRNLEKAQNVINKFGWRHYSDLDTMVQDCNPDVLLIVVNSSAIKQVVLDCLKYKKPIVMETPVWDHDIPNLSSQLNVPVFVNEQTPYLPCEEFKMLLLQTGVFGDVKVAMNDCRTFEYHGISQLRRYVGYDKSPVEIVGSSIPHYPIAFSDNNGNLQQHTEGWDFGTIKFNSNQIAVYNFSSIYNRAPFRKPRSMRIYCDKGTISNDDNDFIVNLLLNDGSTKQVEVNVDGPYMSTKRITADILGQKVVWEKDELTQDLNDQQIAVKHIFSLNLQAIEKNQYHLGYSSLRAFQDVKLLMAIRYSSQVRKVIF